MSALESLRRHSRIVADTSDFAELSAYHPEEATTNPTLILRAVQRDPAQAADLIGASRADQVDEVLVRFGREILNRIPGRVSTEVDARLSFDAEATFARAIALAERYAQANVPAHRVLIKIAATWEGIEAAGRLERQGVHCNLTLVFSLVQARACADAGVQLISPFVGRITDWYRLREGRDFAPDADPGVLSVRRIYADLKQHRYPSEIMAASFRHPGQILALAGCDLLTVSPELLGQLKTMNGPVERQLFAQAEAVDAAIRPAALSEEQFRWELNEDAMASEKLAEGIRVFAADGVKLEQLIAGSGESARSI